MCLDKTADIYNSLSFEEKGTLEKLNITINQKKYSKEEYDCLCVDLAKYYFQKKLLQYNVSIEEYERLIEKLYDIQKKSNF